MANEEWAPPADSALDVEAPIRSVDITAIRDLTGAAFRGAPAAPRLSIHALPPIAAGDTIRYEDTREQSTTSATYITVLDWAFAQPGSVRVTLEHARTAAGSGSSQVRVLVDGSVEGDWQAGGTWTARSIDVEDMVAGTRVVVQHRSTGGPECTIRDIRMKTDGSDIWPSVGYIKFSTAPT